MRKIFVTLCPQDMPEFLPNGIYSELFSSPIYEHTFKKIENAISSLGYHCEVIRASGCNIPDTVKEITAGLEDIVIFASPFAFLASNSDIEQAIDHVYRTDFAYATVGNERGYYMALGVSKILSKSSVGTPTEFVTAVNGDGVSCPYASFAESELSSPKSKADYVQRVERYRQEYLNYLLRFGVDMETLDGIVVSPTAIVEKGVKLNTGCHILGKTHISSGAVIGNNAVIKDSIIGENSTIGTSQIEDCAIEKNVTVDSWCVLKERCHLIAGVKIGNFCELVNTILSSNCTVASHCHIWDSEIGSRVTIGSGVTTINYEINRKNSKCRIGDDSIIGCSSNLVLPVEIGSGAFVAAGSTITDDVPSGALAIAREYQTNRTGWAARRKNNGKHI